MNFIIIIRNFILECCIVGFSGYNKHVLLKIIKIKPGPGEGERKRRKGERERERERMKVKYNCMQINLKRLFNRTKSCT